MVLVKKNKNKVVVVTIVYGWMGTIFHAEEKAVPQLKSGFSGKVQPALLMMTLAA